MSAPRVQSQRRALIVLSLALIAAFAWSRMQVASVERAFPAAGSFVTVGGARVHYYERGSGVPIVLLHGVYGGSEDWRGSIFASVAERGRAIAIDRPSHGYSDPVAGAQTPAGQARWLHAVLHELKVERPLLVGFSWSGALVMSYALQFPDDTLGVMTINAVLHEWDAIMDTSNTVLGLPLAGPLFAHTLGMPLARLFEPAALERAFRPQSIPPSFERSGLWLDVRPQCLLANAAEIRTLKPALRAQSPHYENIAVPLTIVAGLEDVVTHSDFHSFRLHAAVAGSRLVTVEGAGHQILFSHPEPLLHALDDLLAQIASPR